MDILPVYARLKCHSKPQYITMQNQCKPTEMVPKKEAFLNPFSSLHLLSFINLTQLHGFHDTLEKTVRNICSYTRVTMPPKTLGYFQ